MALPDGRVPASKQNEWAMAPLRVRRIERVRLHVDLTILAKLACRLASERALAVSA